MGRRIPIGVAAGLVLILAGCGEPETASIELRPLSTMVRFGGPTSVEHLPPAQTSIDMDKMHGEWAGVQVVVTFKHPPSGNRSDTGIQRDGAEIGVLETWRIWWELLPNRDDMGREIRTTELSDQPEPHLYQVLPVHYAGPKPDKTFPVPPGNEGDIPDVCVPLTVQNRLATVICRRDAATTLLTLFPPNTNGVSWRLHVAPAEAETATPEPVDAVLTIHLKAQPVSLPSRLDFVSATTWDWHIEKYLGRALTVAERTRLLDFFLDYRLTPAAFFTRSADFSSEEIRHILQRGGNVFQVYHIGGGGARELTDAQKTKLQPQLEATRKKFTDAGAGNCCFALIADEPPPEAAPIIRKNAEWLKSVWPELKIWVASTPTRELLDVVDVWGVVTAASTDLYTRHAHTQAGFDLARSAPIQPQYWWFFSVEPYRPAGNCRIDNDLIDARAIGWQSFAQGVDGFEYFWATDWAANAKLKDLPYPAKARQWDLGLSGAGQLCYPLEVDGQVQPIPSLRLVNLRDAMEDWQLFRMAGSALKETFPNPDLKNPDTIDAMRAAALALLAKP